MALTGEEQSVKPRMTTVGRLRSPTGNWSFSIESNKLWKMISTEEPQEVETIQHEFARHVYTTLARTPANMDTFGACHAAMYR